jgi:tRNA(Ile)-lysidine synthase
MRGLGLARVDVDVALNAEALDRRLDPGLNAPIAVAFSGGGDSLAALLMTQAWARRRGRRVIALNIDHRLQPQSADWSRFAAAAAARIGADFLALAWEGAKPSRGLAAAARDARHALIAEAARQAGARVVVFGHTADDILEADLMRAEGSSLGRLREWGPSPAWPAGRDVFLLRPLLGERRAAIRQALRAAGETWIDDPANQDPGSTRARARQRLSDAADPQPQLVLTPPTDRALAELARSVTLAPEGFLRIDRAALRQAPVAATRRLLAAGILCAGGGGKPPRGERLDRLTAQAIGAAPFQATLAGSKIIAAETILLTRDAGEVRRGGLAAVAFPAGVATVWDGRFELTAPRQGLSVRAMGGVMAEVRRRLDPARREALQALPAAVRAGLPVVGGEVGCPILAGPILAGESPVRIRGLVAARFLAACGAISKEPAA